MASVVTSPIGLEAQLRKVDENIIILQTQLEALRGERVILQNQIRQQRSIGHPIHNLPVETICNIFEYVVFSHTTRIRTLLLVCRRWNSIIIHAPRLWSVITIAGPFHPSLFDTIMGYYKTATRRSQKLPLYVTLDTTSLFLASKFCRITRDLLLHDSEVKERGQIWGNCVHMKDQCDTVKQHTLTAYRTLRYMIDLHASKIRWKSFKLIWAATIDIGIFQNQFDSYILDRVTAAAPRLQELSIYDMGHAFHPITIHPNNDFTSLQIREVHFRTWCSLPLETVLELTLEFQQYTMWREVLKWPNHAWHVLFPALRKLSLFRSTDDSSSSGLHLDLEPFTAPYITELAIKGQIPTCALTPMRLPSLRKLTIWSADQSPSFPGNLDLSWSFISNVRHLSFQCFYIDNDTMNLLTGTVSTRIQAYFKDLLQKFPNLECLEICSCMQHATQVRYRCYDPCNQTDNSISFILKQ